MRRIASVSWLCVLPGCGLFGLNAEQRRELALHQSNAALYYEGERWSQALASVNRGLEIAPDDYKLTSIGARIRMLTADSDPRNLDTAARMFRKLEGMRSIHDHAPHALLGLGQFNQSVGLRHWRQAALLQSEAASPDLSDAERQTYALQASEHRLQANYHWREAQRFYGALIEREEVLRVAHKHLMEIAVERNDYEAALAHAESCLSRNETEQKVHRATIEATLSLEEERFAREQLQGLINQEKRVRSALAEMHYRREHFDLAAAELTRLLELDPTRANDYYNRARAYEALGRNADARRDHEKFLAATRLPASDKRVLHAVRFTQSN